MRAFCHNALAPPPHSQTRFIANIARKPSQVSATDSSDSDSVSGSSFESDRESLTSISDSETKSDLTSKMATKQFVSRLSHVPANANVTQGADVSCLEPRGRIRMSKTKALKRTSLYRTKKKLPRAIARTSNSSSAKAVNNNSNRSKM